MFTPKRIAVIFSGLIMLTGIGTGIATATVNSPAATNTSYCVKFGNGPTATGNVVEYNWDRSPCPPNTYAHSITGSAAVADDSATDNNAYLPQIFGTGQQPNGDFSRTDWFIDDVSGRYVCHFTIPVPASAVGQSAATVIACTRIS